MNKVILLNKSVSLFSFAFSKHCFKKQSQCLFFFGKLIIFKNKIQLLTNFQNL